MRIIGALLREPLLHFLAIGAALFALYGWASPQGFGDDNRIVVDAGRIEQLRAYFQRTWNRPPTARELDALIDDFVVEEIFYRRALDLGLDKNDAVIRRRLRQKMEFIAADAIALYQASDEELEAFLQAHPERFRRDASYSFEQRYFSPDRVDGDVRARAEAARQALTAGREVAGDPSLLPDVLERTGASQVDRIFGSGFAQALDGAPVGQWSAPLRSGLGLHVVRVKERRPAYLPSLDEVRAEVEREWQNEKNQQAKAQLLAGLKAEYQIVIERDGVGASG